MLCNVTDSKITGKSSWIWPCVCHQKEELQVYEKYCQNKPRSEVLWRQCGDSLFFQVMNSEDIFEHNLHL